MSYAMTGTFSIFKMSIIPKLTYDFGVILIKISAYFFEEINNLILKFLWKCKGSRIAKQKRNNVGGFTLLISRLFIKLQ